MWVRSVFHVVICEDERRFAAELNGLIERYARETGARLRVSLFRNGLELVEHLRADADLIFLDIGMEALDGLETAGCIRRTDPDVEIIFLTSLAQYALEGYKYNATNYILKPIHYARLKAELDKCMERRERKGAGHIIVENDNGKYKVALNTLKFVETFERKLMVHTDSDDIVSHKKMKDYEAELPAASFARCHNSFLVNLFFVKRVERLEAELTSGERIPISQPKRKAFMEKLTAYWGGRL